MAAEEIITGTIEREVILTILTDLIPSIGTFWGSHITGEHGGVSNIDEELQWQPHVFPIETLIDHLVGEEAKKEFKVSKSDYWLHDPNRTAAIKICHESELHFEVSDNKFRAHILGVLAAHHVGYYSVRGTDS